MVASQTKIMPDMDRDKGFAKLFTKNAIPFLASLSPKNSVVYGLIEEGKTGRAIVMSLADIAKKFGVSEKTASTAVSEMIKADVLRRKADAVLLLNPNFIFQGDNQKRRKALWNYWATETKKPATMTSLSKGA